MRLALTGRHVDVTPALRQLVTRRLAKLERLLNDSVVSTQVVLTLEKRLHKTEVTVHARGDHMLTAVAAAATWPESVAEAAEKVTQQALKVKDRWRSRKRRASGPRQIDGQVPARAAVLAAEQAPAPRIVRVRRYAVKPMRVEDAALRMQEAREPFVVFRHAVTERVNILYERPDGQLGLIDPEI
jgi:putative sigma-54 modulation protein